MATAVLIELMVDEKGAVQGIRSFDTAIKGTAGTTSELDATLKHLNGTMNKTATAGENAGRASGRAMHQVKEDGMSAKEGLNLFREELDLHIPRGFRNLIAQSSAAQSAVKMLGGAIAGIGIAQVGFMVFSQIAEEAHKLWEEHLSLTKAAEDYEEELKKIKEQDFGNTRSIATTELRIREATKAMEEYRRQSEAAAHHKNGETAFVLNAIPGLGDLAQQLANRSAAHDLQKKQYEEQRQLDKLRAENLIEQGHEQRRAEIELGHAKDEQLTKEHRITAEREKQIQLAREDARYNYERDSARGNVTSRNPIAETLFATGKLTPEASKELQAEGEAEAQLHELRKEKARELRRMQEEALEAGLHGVALYRAQEDFAIEELKAKDVDSVAARKALHDKFHAEELKRLQEENLEIQKMREQTSAIGLTGIAKIRQEGQSKISDIYAENALSGKMNPGQLLAAVNEVAKQTQAQINQVYKTFSEQVDGVLRSSTEHTLQGFARIHAEAQKQIADLERDYREKGGRPGDMLRGEAGIRNDESHQVADLQRHNADETAQIEAQAHARSLSAEKQQTLAIQTEYTERVREYREQLDQQMISQEDFNRRVAAAQEERNAQMVEAAKQAREKLAGEFTRFFRDPMGAMKEMGEKAAGEMAARMFQQVQARHHGAPGQQQGFTDQWSLGKIFDHVPGIKSNSVPQSDQHRAETIASGAFTLSHAEIRVAMANISMPAFAGGTTSGAPGATASGAAFSSGSTSSLGLPGTFGGAGSTTDIARVSGPQGMGGSPSFGGATETGGSANPFGAAVSDVKQGIGVVKQAKSIFGSPKSTIANGGGDDDTLGGGGMLDINKVFGSSTTKVTGPSGSSGGMLGGGGIAANAAGAAGGAMGLFSAYQGNGGIGGALGGAMSGMELGMAVGGPIGAAVGLVGGAILGAIGFGGREKARVYDLKTVRPRLGDDFHSFQTGAMDYTSAYSDMQSLDTEARKTLGKMGGSAKAYYWDTINKEIHQAEAKLTAEEKAGRSGQTMSAAQFHQGGWSGDFGSMATGPDTGWAHMREGEFVVHEQAAATHAGALEAIRAGANHSDMARYYGLDSSAQGYRMAMQPSGAGGGSGRTQNITVPIQAIDTKDFVQRIHDVKHHVRAAVNSSYAENSGGSDAGY